MKNKNKLKNIMFFLLGVLISCGVAFADSLSSDSVAYGTNSNVKAALDDLYKKANAGDAGEGDIASGKKALVGGKLVTGTLTCPTCKKYQTDTKVSLSATSISPGGSASIGAGYTDGGTVKCSACPTDVWKVKELDGGRATVVRDSGLGDWSDDGTWQSLSKDLGEGKDRYMTTLTYDTGIKATKYKYLIRIYIGDEFRLKDGSLYIFATHVICTSTLSDSIFSATYENSPATTLVNCSINENGILTMVFKTEGKVTSNDNVMESTFSWQTNTGGVFWIYGTIFYQ